MIPGGWVGATVFYLMAGAIVISLIWQYSMRKADQEKREHDLQKQKLDHRQELDEMAMEKEFGDDDDEVEVESETKHAVPLSPNSSQKPEALDALIASPEELCFLCGSPLSPRQRFQYDTGDVVYTVCDTPKCRDKLHDRLRSEETNVQ